MKLEDNLYRIAISGCRDTCTVATHTEIFQSNVYLTGIRVTLENYHLSIGHEIMHESI